MIEAQVDKSKRQAREDITNGAIRINGERITDLDSIIDPNAAFDGEFEIIRRGKEKYFLGKIK